VVKLTQPFFSVLVGEGASDFAKNRGVNLVHNSTLISDKAMRKYKKYKERLEVSRKALSSGLKITVQPNPSQVIYLVS
jgi:hypothetical protein